MRIWSPYHGESQHNVNRRAHQMSLPYVPFLKKKLVSHLSVSFVWEPRNIKRKKEHLRLPKYYFILLSVLFCEIWRQGTTEGLLTSYSLLSQNISLRVVCVSTVVKDWRLPSQCQWSITIHIIWLGYGLKAPGLTKVCTLQLALNVGSHMSVYVYYELLLHICF